MGAQAGPTREQIREAALAELRAVLMIRVAEDMADRIADRLTTP